MSRVFSQTFGVVGALIEKNGKFLLVRETDTNKADAGKWNHPAGWIDVGEDPTEAVKREVREETGFDFRPTALLGIYSLVREDLHEQLHATPHAIKLIFLGEINEQSSRPLESDVSEIQWFTAEEVDKLGTNLRDCDIKIQIKDYLAGKRYPLEALTHTISK